MTPAVARAHAAKVAAFEARVVAAGTGKLDDKLGACVDALNLYAKTGRGDPAAEKRARKVLARSLHTLGLDVGKSIKPLLADGVKVFADGERVTVDPLDDDLIKTTLRKVDAKVKGKAKVLAFDVITGRAPLRTDAQIRDLAARIMAVGAPAEAASSAVAVRTAALASVKAADGSPLVWMAQPGCCGHCASMAGAVRRQEGDVFVPRLRVVDRPLPWAEDGVEAPPLHDHCRCVLVPASAGLADALAKNAARDVATGKVGHMSAPAKARAARRLLRSRAPLTPAAAKKAAALAKAAGI
jgi:hypothetical protein